MDTFVDSSWYFARFVTPRNESNIFDSGVVNRWLFAALGAPALARAVVRARRGAREPLDRRVERLRSVPRFRFRALVDPRAWSGFVGRSVRFLPVDGGPCLRRALVLLDLHARCGLDPKLELALRPAPGQEIPEGHAWLSTDEGPRRAAEQAGTGWHPIVRL
jgi:hypothetical protein